MPTRCNRHFYCRSYCLLNMFRASPYPSSGDQEYYTVVAACGILCCGFSSSWSGVELRVMRPVCRMLQHPENRTHNPQLHTRPATWKTTAQNTTRSNHCIILFELLMMGIVMPETCWASNKICNKKPLLHLVGILFPHNIHEFWHILCSKMYHYVKDKGIARVSVPK